MKNDQTDLTGLLKKINVWLIQAIVILIPFHHKFIAPIIVLWILNSLISIFALKLRPAGSAALKIVLLFYVILFIGILWSNNIKMGWFDLEVKLSLFIFPFFFSFIKLSLPEIKTILKTFIYAVAMSGFGLLIQAMLNFIPTGDYQYFFYTHLSFIIHPSYLSFYCSFALVVLLIDMQFDYLKVFSYKYGKLVLFSIIFLFNILLVSKIGLIVSFIIVVTLIVNLFLLLKKYVFGSILVLSLLLFSTILYTQVNAVKLRVDELVLGLTEDFGGNNQGSSSVRLKIWSISAKLISEKPILGYGTGDVKDVLVEQYKIEKLREATSRKYNAHNQFLQVGIATGLLGLAIFMSIFVFSIKNALQHHNYLLLCFSILCLLYFFPESVLENQAGTIFFGLFFSILNQKSLFSNENSHSNPVLSA